MNTAKTTVSQLFAATILASMAFLAIAPTASAHAGHDHDTDEASCWISASPSTVNEGGSATLTWGSSNADDAWIEDIGDVSNAGSRVIYGIDEDTTFTLTVENDEGTASCETDVEVREHYAPTGKAPGCTIWRENRQGGVMLRWNTTSASSAFLSGVGSVAPYGQYAVYPMNDTTYTLTVYGNGQSRTCEIEVERSNGTYSYYPQPTYTQPYVLLTQIPYTGIGLDGAAGVMYFLSLALFAIAGAYLLTYYQGGVLRLSFANEVKAAMRNQARAIRNIFKQ